MPKTTCAVAGCSSRKVDAMMHRFPMTVERAEKWREACKNPKLSTVPVEKLHDVYAVCRKHFARHQYTNSLMNRLNRNTVPSLFLPKSDACELDDCVVVDVTVPPVGTENVEVLPVVSDVEDHFSDSNDQNSNVNEGEHSVSSDAPPSALGLSSSRETETSLPKPVMSSGTISLLNDYYRYTLCRLCFSSDDHLVNIFEDKQECGFLISDAIEDLLQFTVSKTDDFPQFICSNCCARLCQFKEFKESLLKMKKEFEKSLFILRKGTEKDENTPENLDSDNEFLTLKNMGESKDCNDMEPLCELRETTEDDFAVDYSEVLSDLEEPFTDLEDIEGQDESESETGKKIVSCMTEIVLEGEYKCFECGEEFQFRNLLTKHLMEHRKTWPVPCQYCDKRFRTLLDLNNHIVMHSNYKPYECEHCGLRCRLKATLAKHKMIHSDDKPFLCSVCGANFRDGGLLKSHLRMHSGINCYKCEECGSQFTSNSKLVRHLHTHSSKRTHVCGDCGKSFRQWKTLGQHITRVHQREKRYQCGVCSDKYGSKKALSEHMKIHLKQICPSEMIVMMT
ncbi:zinc finger protein 675-like isoform X2 [Ischnura elegans]|uniref:zinc finger protein 675-like isoform X2 n=1 Tax=Ischnura elegans TaxID=197161 RepID=UPI001ED88D08|nr:zinc finger protein 675-like isoform X2 [Ischnura elegans]